MRLPIAARLRPLQKLLLWAFKTFIGDPPGPMLVASYNKPFFGEAWAPFVKAAMRGATEWSVGEVELFAAFVSRLNACGY